MSVLIKKEYIEREAFKAEIRRLSTHYLNEWDTLGVLAAADRIHAADVRPVVRAKWIPVEEETGVEAFGFKEKTVVAFRCSTCDKEVDVSEGNFNFCPCCGADMRKES